MIADLEVYDTVSLDTVEVGDNILLGEDVLTITKILTENDDVLLHGDSYITGDSAFYIRNADTQVDLWTA